MDALMAALVAALLCHASDRTPWTAALLGTRHASRKGAVVAGTALAIAAGNVLGAVGGVLVAPLLSPDASALLLALALLSGGLTAFWPPKPAKARDWRVGAFLSSLLAIGALGLGDRTQFVTATLAARGDTPVSGAVGAAVGATIGALAVDIPAILLGERRLATLPATALRIGTAAGLVLWGAIAGLGALRLI